MRSSKIYTDSILKQAIELHEKENLKWAEVAVKLNLPSEDSLKVAISLYRKKHNLPTDRNTLLFPNELLARIKTELTNNPKITPTDIARREKLNLNSLITMLSKYKREHNKSQNYTALSNPIPSQPPKPSQPVVQLSTEICLSKGIIKSCQGHAVINKLYCQNCQLARDKVTQSLAD
ncbi:MAG: hypothetical protein WAZ18_05265 [Alphaproteobacteria bacterium]